MRAVVLVIIAAMIASAVAVDVDSQKLARRLKRSTRTHSALLAKTQSQVLVTACEKLGQAQCVASAGACEQANKQAGSCGFANGKCICTPCQYAPGPHEAWHVCQQKAGVVAPTAQAKL
jgi:hypothetical protein